MEPVPCGPAEAGGAPAEAREEAAAAGALRPREGPEQFSVPDPVGTRGLLVQPLCGVLGCLGWTSPFPGACCVPGVMFACSGVSRIRDLRH